MCIRDRFKTPIVSIRGFARQLKKGNLTPQQRCEYTDIILSEAERLANMSSNILLLTKFENQQIITDRSCFQLDEQLRNCILLLEKQWGQKGIALNLELSPTPFYGNEEMLSHVWVNLLSNAIKFSPAESEKMCIRDRRRTQLGSGSVTCNRTGITF